MALRIYTESVRDGIFGITQYRDVLKPHIILTPTTILPIQSASAQPHSRYNHVLADLTFQQPQRSRLVYITRAADGGIPTIASVPPVQQCVCGACRNK